MFAPQAQELLEKLAEILLYNFHREHILLKLKIKKLLRKIKSKNLTAGFFFNSQCPGWERVKYKYFYTTVPYIFECVTHQVLDSTKDGWTDGHNIPGAS